MRDTNESRKRRSPWWMDHRIVSILLGLVLFLLLIGLPKFLLARTATGHMRNMIKVNGDGFLSQPFEPREVIQRVEELLCA